MRTNYLEMDMRLQKVSIKIEIKGSKVQCQY